MNSLVFEAEIDNNHNVHLPEELPVGTRVRIHVEPLSDATASEQVQGQSEIRRLALAARRAYLKRGGKLLSIDEVNEEVRRRRGGVSND